MCGEQQHFQLHSVPNLGSSPRVRGAVLDTCGKGGRGGIIPACAGSSVPAFPICWIRWDHPRVCGEQCSRWSRCYAEEGSSPRVRGAERKNGAWYASKGIIPACAGSSSPCARSPRPNRDHPRVCGEQWVLTCAVTAHSGSSPRVRGAVAIVLAAEKGSGIIPACAGSSVNPWAACNA